MGLVIISVILTIITVIAIAASCVAEEESAWPCILGFLWLLIILFGCFANIGANTVGIMYNPFKGGIQDEVLNEGFRTKSPLEKVYKISTEVQELNFENMSVQTNDSQYVNAKIQVQVRISKENAFNFFKKYGNKRLDDISNIISNTIQKQLETVTTQYNIMEILGEKRNEIVNKTLELAKTELEKDGITVERLVLVDTDSGDAIEQAIANEAVKKKEAEAAQYEKEKAELEGEAQKVKAQKEGEAKVIQAQKEKEANDLLRQSLTPEILQQQMLEKWNGTLPTTMLNDNIMSTFNVNQ